MGEQLEIFLQCVRHYIHASSYSEQHEQNWAIAEVYRHEATAKQILKRLDPPLADFHSGGVFEFTAEANTVRGLGILADMDEWAVRLEPDAPALSADRLHPWVWGAQ